MVCKCSAFADGVSLLEGRACQLKQLISAKVTLDVTGTPDSFRHRLDIKSVSDSTSLASLEDDDDYPCSAAWEGPSLTTQCFL